MKQVLWICVVATISCIGTTAAPANEGASPAALDQKQLEEFRARINALKPELVEHGVDPALANRALDTLEPDPDVIRLSRSQPEHTRTTGDYVTAVVSPERVSAGKVALKSHTQLLAKLEEKYGVPANILVAVWGIESRYGKSTGTRSVIRSLSTLTAFDKRRANFWKRQLIAALRIAGRGDVSHDNMTGSWAGAMGHTQFIPTTFEAFGEDFDGDGKANIWTSHVDALASAAHYLQQSGWQRMPERRSSWGYEVILPDGFDFSTSGLSNQQTGKEWTKVYVRCARGGTIPPNTKFSLLLPQGATGPAFLVTNNFRVILRYNNAISYALAVAHLSHRIVDGKPLKRAWRNVKPLTRSQRMRLQEVLVARGYDTGGIDGILGRKSAQALRREQHKRELPADGFADLAILKMLQHSGFPHAGETE